MAPGRPNLEEEGSRGGVASPLVMVHGTSEGSAEDPPVAIPLGTREFHCQQIFSTANGMVHVKEEDGASDSLPDVRTVVETSYEDNDLTSLTWLQDRNLLKGMNLRSGDSLSPEGDAHLSNDDEGGLDDDGLNPIGGTISPTSDYADSTSSGGGRRSPGSPDDRSSKKLRRQPVLLSHPVGNPPLPIMTRLKLQHSSNQNHVGPAAGNQRPYNPQVHVNSKPPFSFSCLIFMAIEDSAKKALPVKEIYAWILEHFPYFKDAPTGWKNSVRHNLSLNKCFKKVDKAQNFGKGSLWMVDDIFRPNLLQALKKAPFQPHAHLEQVSVITNGLNVKSPNPSGGDYIVLSGTKSKCNVPDPELFPLLSRRLAAASGKDLARASSDASSQRRRHRNVMKARDSVPLSNMTPYSSDTLEDVDAAAAMLALKHGPRILFSGKDDWQPEEVDALKEYPKGFCSRKTSDKTCNTNQLLPVITSSPSEDHTYSAGRQVGSPAMSVAPVSQWSSRGQHLPIPLAASSSSPDEAFSEGSASSESDDSVAEQSSRGMKLPREECDLEEQRKIAEGADALLNLAGICTGGEEVGGGLPKGGGGARRKRGPDGSPVDLSSQVKVRVLEGKEPQVDALHSNQSSPGRCSIRFSRAKKGWSHSTNKVSKTTGHSSRARVTGLNVRLKDKKKQIRRVEDKMFRMKR